VPEVQKHQGKTADHAFSDRNLFKELIYAMRCPHCNQEIAGKACPQCGENVPSESLYCMKCGAPFEEKTSEDTAQDDDFDLEDRVLCSDGTCTGIIVNGRCTECGKPAGK